MTKAFKRLAYSLSLLWGISPLKATLSYTFQDNPLTLPLSKVESTRLFVKADRIRKLVGDLEAFEIESDEDEGQIWIKPLRDRLPKLTLLTEGGRIQDLRFVLKKGLSETLQLKESSDLSLKDPLKGSLRERLLSLFHQIQSRPLMPFDTLRTYEGFELSGLKRLIEGDLLCETFKITSRKRQPLSLSQRDFQKKGDRAIHLQEAFLKPGESTTLTLISKRFP